MIKNGMLLCKFTTIKGSISHFGMAVSHHSESSKQGISPERKEMGGERAGQVGGGKFQILSRQDGARY